MADNENEESTHNNTNVTKEVDLEKEVSNLSTRLIEAIDKQVDLGDQVKVLRKELDNERRQKLALEDQISNGHYVPKSVSEEAERLRDEAVAEAAKLRGETVDLTGKLFDEANVLVASAKRETADIQRKNDSLQAQIDEKDTLLEALQQQLTELKLVLENATSKDQVDSTNNKRISSRISMGPSTTSSASKEENSESPCIDSQEIPNWDLVGDEYLYSPLRPVFRYDLSQFKEFLFMAQGIPVKNALSSGSPGSETTNDTSSPRFHFFGNSLKEFKFFKRSLADDIEPTLRLDQAPGVSWLGRRSITSAIMEGTVVIEPIASINERSTTFTQSDKSNGECDRPIATLSPCSFCGEARNSHLIYARMHNLRVDEKTDHSTISTKPLLYKSASSSAVSEPVKEDGIFTRTNNSTNSSTITTNTERSAPSSSSTSSISNGYPMCHHCLTRIRAVCDFVSFIRSIRDGLWKIGTFETNARAWQECQKLRERMFYARIGARFMMDYEKRDVDVIDRHIDEPMHDAVDRTNIEDDKEKESNLANNSMDSSDEEAEFLDSYEEGVMEVTRVEVQRAKSTGHKVD